ncbi:hypothetical protein ACGFIR_09055 [Micromonospora sp. NPDC049051]|uniref:hypothetical protein n=1 Tax=unclassified Micromonospora TaxID=2617518 RepID=UPI00371E9DAA
MGEQRQGHTGEAAPGVPQDAAARETREAQDAHGGSMAPALVDDTGHPVADDPTEVAGEDTDGG